MKIFFPAAVLLLFRPRFATASELRGDGGVIGDDDDGGGSAGLLVVDDRRRRSPAGEQSPRRTNAAAAAAAVDGICSKRVASGYHGGTYLSSLGPSESPNGLVWTWRQCARECALSAGLAPRTCQFWTLQLTGARQCLLMADEGSYVDTTNHYEGEYDEDCLTDDTFDDGTYGWNFTWSDEFHGPTIDDGIWGYEEGYVRNDELQYYSKREENSRIEDGKLLIEARREPFLGMDYTSASRRTLGKKSFLYGRFQIRAKIDVRAGSWPAWWWLPDTGGWPTGGEIDMMEYYQSKLLFNIMDGDTTWRSVQVGLADVGGTSWAESYHVWTWDWTPDRIRLFLDGTLLNDYDVADADGTGPGGENPFRRSGYVLLNQAIGGTAGGDPSGTSFPVRYYVDWIRHWEYDTSSNGAVLVVHDGSGAGKYTVDGAATVVARTAPAGMEFDAWVVTAGGTGGAAIISDAAADETTVTVPAGGATLTATYRDVVPTSPTSAPAPGPTLAPTGSPTDGVCSTYATTGWHYGTYLRVLQPAEAPDGSQWTWQQCAEACALSADLPRPCEFWTLQLAGQGKCLLMADQGAYVETHSHAEGDRDDDCLATTPVATPAPSSAAPITPGPTDDPTVAPTAPKTTASPTAPTAPPTREPTSDPTTTPTGGPTAPPTRAPTDSPTVSPADVPTDPPAPCSLAGIDESCVKDKDCCSGLCTGGKPSGRVCYA